MDDANKTITVDYNKAVLLLLSLISLLFILEGVWLVDVSYWPGAFAPISLRVIAGLLIVVFVMPLIIYGKKLFTQQMALIIRAEGMTDNASIVVHPFIHWNNIEQLHLYVQKITAFSNFSLNTKYVQIILKNPNDYIQTFSLFKRVLLRFYNLLYKTPILLNTTGLKIKPNQLYKVLQVQLANYRHQQMQH
jgi:hypothetical protein